MPRRSFVSRAYSVLGVYKHVLLEYMCIMNHFQGICDVFNRKLYIKANMCSNGLSMCI